MERKMGAAKRENESSEGSGKKRKKAQRDRDTSANNAENVPLPNNDRLRSPDITSRAAIGQEIA